MVYNPTRELSSCKLELWELCIAQHTKWRSSLLHQSTSGLHTSLQLWSRVKHPSFMPTQQGWHRLSLMLHHIFEFCLLEFDLSHMQIAKTHAKYCCNHDLCVALVANIECFSNPSSVSMLKHSWIRMGFSDPWGFEQFMVFVWMKAYTWNKIDVPNLVNLS